MPYLGVLEAHGNHDVTRALACVAALLECGEHAVETDGEKRVLELVFLGLLVDPMHGLDVDAVALILILMNLLDVILDGLRLLEVGEFVAGGLKGMGRLLHDVNHLDDFRRDDGDVMHVDALQDIVELVNDGIKLIGKFKDVLTFDRCDELEDEVLGDGLNDAVGLLLDLVQDVIMLENFCRTDSTHVLFLVIMTRQVIDKRIGIFNGAVADFHERLEVVKLMLVCHRLAFLDLPTIYCTR